MEVAKFPFSNSALIISDSAALEVFCPQKQRFMGLVYKSSALWANPTPCFVYYNKKY